jgi:acetyltransferase-like isoleucine patch superfamily enzyme
MLSNAEFWATDFHAVIDANSKKRLNYARQITVGNHVWAGTDVRILKNVEIGANSVIGMRSVVTRSVGVGSLAVGTPARVVKTNISWRRE